MAQKFVSIDISNAPDLKRLAEAVRQSGKLHALREGAETIAVVRPAPKREQRRRTTRQVSRSDRSQAPLITDPAIAQLLEDALRVNRETPVDPALFAPPSPEVLAQRRAVYDEIQAHRHQRVIAPLTASDLIHIARAEEEEAYGFGH